MSTKSIVKNVTIKDKRSAAALVSALENAKCKCAKPVMPQKSFSDATRIEIRKMFCK